MPPALAFIIDQSTTANALIAPDGVGPLSLYPARALRSHGSERLLNDRHSSFAI